jgi:hypothetical protein
MCMTRHTLLLHHFELFDHWRAHQLAAEQAEQHRQQQLIAQAPRQRVHHHGGPAAMAQRFGLASMPWRQP